MQPWLHSKQPLHIVGRKVRFLLQFPAISTEPTLQQSRCVLCSVWAKTSLWQNHEAYFQNCSQIPETSDEGMGCHIIAEKILPALLLLFVFHIIYIEVRTLFFTHSWNFTLSLFIRPFLEDYESQEWNSLYQILTSEILAVVALHLKANERGAKISLNPRSACRGKPQMLL